MAGGMSTIYISLGEYAFLKWVFISIVDSVVRSVIDTGFDVPSTHDLMGLETVVRTPLT